MMTSRAHTEMDGKNPRLFSLYNVKAQAVYSILELPTLSSSLLELAYGLTNVICLLYYFARHL